MRSLAATSTMCFAAALCLVLAGIGWRWHGVRTDSAAYVALGPLSAKEAANLIDAGRGWIVALDDTAVQVTTGSYFVSGPCRECRALVTRRGKTLFTSAVSSSQFKTSHTLRRQDLESALGRKLWPSDVDKTAALAPVSYESRLWSLYAATETLLLGMAFTLLAVVWRALGFLPATITAAALAAVIPLVVLAYSPAFLDTDFFYQRIILEFFVNPLLGFAIFMTVPIAFQLPRLKLLEPVYRQVYS